MVTPNNQANFQNVNQQGRLSNAFFINGGRNAAIAYPVAAGYEAFLVDEEAKMFFIKKNDGSGRGFNLREFEYEEVTPIPEQPSISPTNFDPSKYVTKEDFNALLEEVRKISGGRSKEHTYSRNTRRSRNAKQFGDE